MDPNEGMTEQISACGKDANEGMSKDGKDANEGMSTYQSATHCEGGGVQRKAEDVLSRIIPKFGDQEFLMQLPCGEGHWGEGKT